MHGPEFRHQRSTFIPGVPQNSAGPPPEDPPPVPYVPLPEGTVVTAGGQIEAPREPEPIADLLGESEPIAEPLGESEPIAEPLGESESQVLP